MLLTIFGKELIIINEEIVIYLSFLLVLTLLVTNFGKQVSDQFSEQAKTIAQNYSLGAEEKVKTLLFKLRENSRNINFITYLIHNESLATKNLLQFKELLVAAGKGAEYRLL